MINNKHTPEPLDTSIIDNIVRMSHATVQDKELAIASVLSLWSQMDLNQKRIISTFCKDIENPLFSNGLIKAYPRFRGGWAGHVPNYTSYEKAYQFVDNNSDLTIDFI